MIRRFCRRYQEGLMLTVMVTLGAIAAWLVAAYAIAIAVTPWTS